MTTKHISLTGKPYETIRIDEVHGDTLITVYNINVTDIDALISKLQELKVEYAPKPEVVTPSSIMIDDVTVVEVVKPDPTDWYKNALSKASANAKLNSMPERKLITLPDPVMPQPRKSHSVINVIGVMTKANKHVPSVRKANENADIIKGAAIRIYGISDERMKYDRETATTTLYKVAYDKSFKVGDTAVYDSYNNSYTATIESIGEKTITFKVQGQSRKVQLDLHTFIRHNWDYSPDKIAEERANFYD